MVRDALKHAYEAGRRAPPPPPTRCICPVRLMEIDPAYCDVIVQRWEKFTGKRAERVTGEAAAQSDSCVSARR